VVVLEVIHLQIQVEGVMDPLQHLELYLPLVVEEEDVETQH
jgi:hypothetical protein